MGLPAANDATHLIMQSAYIKLLLLGIYVPVRWSNQLTSMISDENGHDCRQPSLPAFSESFLFFLIEVRFPSQKHETVYVSLKFMHLVVGHNNNPLPIFIIFCDIENTDILQIYNIRKEAS